MKTKNIILGIIASFISIAVMAGGNDPQASSSNYKHPNKAAKAKAVEDAEAQQEKTVVVKKTQGPANYKTNFQKAEYSTEVVPANQGTFRTDYKARNHNYKRQF